MDGFERGVLIDGDGFFLSALQWQTGTPAPSFDKKLTKGKAPRLILLRDPYAIENVDEGARWDFTPVRELQDPDDPNSPNVLVRSGTWLFPTERRWIVGIRRDKPGYGFLIGSRKVWPDRLPRLSPGRTWVEIEPPAWHAQKPLYRFDPGEWFFPAAVATVDAEGKVKAVQRVIDPADAVHAPGDQVVETVDIEAEDELGSVTKVEVGDTLDPDTLTLQKRQRRLGRIPTSTLRAALQKQKLLSSFMQFGQSKGYSALDIDGTLGISLTSPFFREWLESEGLTLKQAYSQLQPAIEEAAELVSSEFEG